MMAERSKGNGSASSASSKQQDVQEVPKNVELGYAACTVDSGGFASTRDFVVDSGASHYVVIHEGWFESLKEVPTIDIYLAKSGETVPCNKVGVVYISVADNERNGTWLKLNNFLYVTSLDSNLISVPSLPKLGSRTTFGYPQCSIWDIEGVFGVGDIDGEIYKLRARPRKTTHGYAKKANSGSNKNLELWHNRMGHLSKQKLLKMINSGTAEGMENKIEAKREEHCAPCQEGKQHRVSFKGEFSESVSIGEVIHSDFCGPLSVLSFGGAKYFVTFVDQRSRFLTTTSMQPKSQVLSKFIKFKRHFEKQHDVCIKHLHSDNGGKYEGMRKYLDENGIIYTRGAPYSPEQNGIAERMNRLLVEMIRAMLYRSGLDLRFWVEALSCAADIKNCTITKPLKTKTLFEVLYGKKPNVKYS